MRCRSLSSEVWSPAHENLTNNKVIDVIVTIVMIDAMIVPALTVCSSESEAGTEICYQTPEVSDAPIPTKDPSKRTSVDTSSGRTEIATSLPLIFGVKLFPVNYH